MYSRSTSSRFASLTSSPRSFRYLQETRRTNSISTSKKKKTSDRQTWADGPLVRPIERRCSTCRTDRKLNERMESRRTRGETNIGEVSRRARRRRTTSRRRISSPAVPLPTFRSSSSSSWVDGGRRGQSTGLCPVETSTHEGDRHSSEEGVSP